MANKDDLSKLGWTLEDFGISRQEYQKVNQPSQSFSPNYVTGVSGGFTQAPKSAVPKKLSDFRETESPQTYLPDTVPGVSAANLNLVNPQEQSGLQDYLEDQSMFEQVTDRSKRFLSRLFDTEDEKETVVESAWDGFLRGVGWFYDRINQVSAAGLSGLPGGVRTLTWDEAGDVSVGQVAVANAALSAQQIEEGNVFSGLLGLASAGPIGLLGTGISEDVIGPDFDITNEAERNRAFVEDPLGKWTSGLTDAVFTIAADPLIVAGKALKVARIRWVDQPIVSEKQMDELANNLARDNSIILRSQTEKVEPQGLSSQGDFLNWVGQENRTYDEVYNHIAIRDAGSRDQITALLMGADNFEERSLVLRVAYGDKRARQELMTKRSDLADSAGKMQRERLTVLMAAKPQDVNKIKDFYRAKANELDMEYQRLVENNASDGVIQAAARKRDQYIDLADDLDNGRLLRDPLAKPLTKEEIQFAKTVVNDFYVARDNWLRKAVDDEIAGSLQEGNKQITANNIIGRAVERSRQRRAEASAEMEGATLRSIWRSEDYTPLGKAGRTVRLWRWFGKEKPAGFITTRGPATQEQYREIRANLNNINIYNLPAKEVSIGGKTVLIGGKERKEELIRRYMDAVGTSIEDQNKMSLAINALEHQIIKDMAAWHGMNAKDANILVGQVFSKRKELIDDIRNKGFWVDEDGNVQKAPYLETQLQNGTYLLNYRAINRAMSVAQKEGLIPALNSSVSFGAEKAATIYNGFNSIWRPAVLLRLGYTQRNFVEGAFRASAFVGSLAPLGYAGKQVGFGFRNAVVSRRVEREAKRVEGILSSGEAATRLGGTRFQKWRDTQEAVLIERLAKEQEWLDSKKAQVAVMDKTDPQYQVLIRDIDIMEQQLRDAKTTQTLLKDDYSALALYKGQAGQKRRVFDGEYEREDPFLSYKAFGNPRFTDMAWGNMSADATTRATLTLRMQTSERLFRNVINRNYVAVTPDKGDAYFRGVAEMLKQYRASEIGRRLINNEDPRSIATWLRTSDEGKEIVRFLNGNIGPKKGRQKAMMDAPIRTYDDALDYVMKVRERFNALTPNPALRKAMLDDKAVLRDNFWKDVKRLLDTDDYRDSLIPAIGNVAVETGWKQLRDIADGAVQQAFRFLGTLPEDAFVRAPFYGRRYNDTREVLYRSLRDQYKGETVPFFEIQRIERVAHRRALKDTKDWLYTIERRTNLGHYGEFILPFITATQNSVTALGRLTWRDPSILGVVNLLWQAPSRAGLEDENGNIVIPLPEGIIPDGLADAVGLDNMRNIKISKGSLNVVFPETGFGFIPRPGPIFAVPASEIMKNGLFGVSVETPGVLRSALGEDVANEVWNNFRDYIFGEESGISAETLSWNMVAPPFAAKIIQMFQGEAGSTSYAYMYNLQYRTEMMKVLAGDRDFPETMEEFRSEIKSRTNNMFLLRMLANLTAFTPPQYESKLEPLIQTIRKYEEKDPVNGLRKFNEDYGNIMLLLGDFSVSKNVAGVRGEVKAVDNARRYANVIANVAPQIQDDLNTLGIILNDGTEGLYDGSAYAWQRTATIPGLNRTYREIQTPEQAMVESSKNAGWTQFISFMDSLDAILQQRGLTSYRSAGAADLKDLKDQFIAKLSTNPLYQGWYQDYIDFGSTRTVSAVKVMEAALSDPKFVDDHEEDPLWIAAAQYLELRRDVITLVEASGSGINAEVNQQVRELWDSGRQRLVNQSTKWASIANRYLNGDDDPMNPGANLAQVLATTTEATGG